MISSQEQGYFALCYHYIRPPKELDPRSDLLGNTESELIEHLVMVRDNFYIMTPEEVSDFSYNKFKLGDRHGMYLTFDDGLSDHYRAATILHKHGVKATFFIPTCIFEDSLPANPIIIHYALSIYRISGLLNAYREALKRVGVDSNHDINFRKGTDDPWQAIKKIKNKFRFEFSYQEGRQILIDIYNNLLLARNPDILEDMHLTRGQVTEILGMGHTIGVHTRSHVSVGATDLNPEQTSLEIIAPKSFLENTFNTEVTSFSYPFGEVKDCLSSKELLEKTKAYQTAYLATPCFNTPRTSPYELGRLMPWGSESATTLKEKIDSISICNDK